MQLRWPEDGVCLFVPAIAHVEVFLVISAYPRGSPPAVGTAASRPLRRIRLPPHPRTVTVIIGGFVAIGVFLCREKIAGVKTNLQKKTEHID